MSSYHAVVWMDHAQAHVVLFGKEHAESHRIRSRSHHKHQGKGTDLSGLFADIAKALEGCKEILLTGPGLVRNQFREW